MNNFNSQFLYSVIIILLGYILKRSAIIKEKDGEGLFAFAIFSGVQVRPEVRRYAFEYNDPLKFRVAMGYFHDYDVDGQVRPSMISI